MSKIVTDSGSKDAGLGFKPRDAGLQAMNFQTDKGTDRQANLIEQCRYYTFQQLECQGYPEGHVMQKLSARQSISAAIVSQRGESARVEHPPDGFEWN